MVADRFGLVKLFYCHEQASYVFQAVTLLGRRPGGASMGVIAGRSPRVCARHADP